MCGIAPILRGIEELLIGRHQLAASEPGAWEPTPPGFNPNQLQPCWGQIRPMVLTSSGECPPPGHPAFSTDPASDFHCELGE